MRASDEQPDHVLCDSNDVCFVRDILGDEHEPDFVEGLATFDVGSEPVVLERLQSHASLSVTRYLDHFYVVTRVGTERASQSTLLQMFFTHISDRYDSLIDGNRNKENISTMLSILESRGIILEKAQIIDFGCGTGLAHDVALARGVTLIGYDINDGMAAKARDRGMKVWGREELEEAPSATYEGAIASYVFHLLPQLDSLYHLWRVIRPGAMIAANFHKNKGLGETCEHIASLGGSVELLPEQCGCESHGTYAVFTKR